MPNKYTGGEKSICKTEEKDDSNRTFILILQRIHSNFINFFKSKTPCLHSRAGVTDEVEKNILD